MNDQINQKIEELKSYGLDDAKISALSELALQDFMAEFEDDLTKASLENLEEIEVSLKNVTLNKVMSGEDNLFMETLKKVYGVLAEDKLQTFVLEYFDDAVRQAKMAKDLLNKYNSGDPETVKAVDDVKESEDYDTMSGLISRFSSNQ